MKGNSATFSFIILIIIYLIVKQNLGHAWFLGPHTLDKLILVIIYLSVKQNISSVWFLEPHTLGNLHLQLSKSTVNWNSKCSPEYDSHLGSYALDR